MFEIINFLALLLLVLCMFVECRTVHNREHIEWTFVHKWLDKRMQTKDHKVVAEGFIAMAYLTIFSLTEALATGAVAMLQLLHTAPVATVCVMTVIYGVWVVFNNRGGNK